MGLLNSPVPTEFAGYDYMKDSPESDLNMSGKAEAMKILLAAAQAARQGLPEHLQANVGQPMESPGVNMQEKMMELLNSAGMFQGLAQSEDLVQAFTKAFGVNPYDLQGM